MIRGVDQRRRQKKAGYGSTKTRSHFPILQGIRLSRKTAATMAATMINTMAMTTHGEVNEKLEKAKPSSRQAA